MQVQACVTTIIYKHRSCGLKRNTFTLVMHHFERNSIHLHISNYANVLASIILKTNYMLYIIGLFIRAKSKSNEIKVMLYHQNYPKDICLDNPSSSAMNHNSCIVFCVGGDKTYSSILKPMFLMFNGSFCLHMTFVGNVHCCYLFERLLLYILFI